MKYLLSTSIIIISLNSFGQVLLPDCPYPNATDRAYRHVKFFLTLDPWKQNRQECGAIDIPETQIRAVADANTCGKLYSIIDGNSKYKNINDNLSDDRTLFFYRTDDFYYIFWDYKPEPESAPGTVRIRTGPRTLFIVMSKDFKSIWEFYT